MNKTRLVVFDMAGTTVKDKGGVAQAFINAFGQFNIVVPVEEVKKVMGYRKRDAIRMLLDKFYPEKATDKQHLIEEIHEVFENSMTDYYMSEKDLQPLPNAENTFRWLHERGVKVALNTGFTKIITDAILYRLGWKDSKLIDVVISSDEVEEGRPAPYMINEVMKRVGVEDTSGVVKVGDTEVDVIEGRNANCGLVISVTTGAYSRQQLEQYHPDKIIDSLSELPSLIQ
jgi:phosphonatase-like hydrolase